MSAPGAKAPTTRAGHSATVAGDLCLVDVPGVPAVVDGVSVRLVASLVLVVGALAIGFQQWWLYALLGIDFTIRAMFGPRFSPLAIVVRRWLRPALRVASQPTAFAPKRFAAGIGAVFTAAITGLWIVGSLIGTSGLQPVAWGLAIAMLVFPALEAFFGFCVGCRIFALLARAGVVSPDVCIDCTEPVIDLRD